MIIYVIFQFIVAPYIIYIGGNRDSLMLTSSLGRWQSSLTSVSLPPTIQSTNWNFFNINLSINVYIFIIAITLFIVNCFILQILSIFSHANNYPFTCTHYISISCPLFFNYLIGCYTNSSVSSRFFSCKQLSFSFYIFLLALSYPY